MISGIRAGNLSKHTSQMSESASSRDTLAYEHGSVFKSRQPVVSFSAWAEFVWRYRLEVTNSVYRVRSLDHVRVKNISNISLHPAASNESETLCCDPSHQSKTQSNLDAPPFCQVFPRFMKKVFEIQEKLGSLLEGLQPDSAAHNPNPSPSMRGTSRNFNQQSLG